MKKSFFYFWAVAVTASVFFALPTAADTPSKGKLETVRLTTTLVRPFRGTDPKRDILIYTPLAYYAPSGAARRFPVVYLLHGSPGNPNNFTKLGQWPEKLEAAVKAGQIQPVVFVIPNGNYVGQKQGDSEWADSADRRDRFETWLVKEVVPYVDSHYRTRTEPAGRLLGGVSEGGFGSVNLALRNPKVFGTAIGLSGYYDMRGFGWGHIIMNESEAAMSYNSPLFYVPEKISASRVPPEWKALRIFVGAGSEEKPYADHTKRVGAALQQAGVKTVIIRFPDGKHDWNLWGEMFFEALRAFLPGSGGGNGNGTN